MEERSKILIVCIAVILIAAVSSVFIIYTSQTQTELIIENDSIEQGQTIEIMLVDDKDNGLPNKEIEVIIKGDDGEENYTATTDDNGIANLNLNQDPGTYSITAKFSKSGYKTSQIKKEITVTQTTINKISTDENTQTTSSPTYPAKHTTDIGSYVIVEEGYGGFDITALVRDSQGRLWVKGGDGYYEPSYFDYITKDDERPR